MSTINEYFEKKNRGSRTASSAPVSGGEPVSYINAYFEKKGGNPVQSTPYADAAKTAGVTSTPYADAAKAQSGKNNSILHGLAGIAEKAWAGAREGLRTGLNEAGYRAQIAAPLNAADDAYYKTMWEQTTGRKTGVEIPKDTRTQEQKDLDEFMGVGDLYSDAARAMQKAAEKGYERLDEENLKTMFTRDGTYQQKTDEKYADLGPKWQRAMEIAGSVGNQALPLAGRYAATLLTGNQKAGELAQSILFFNQASGASIEEALADGAKWDEAATYGTVIGGIEAATELAGDMAGKALVKAGGKAMPKEQFTKALIGTITGNKGMRTFLSIIGSMNGEGLEEVASDLASPFARSIYNGKTLGENWMDEVTLAGLWQSYLGGAVSGGIFAGLTGAATGQFRAQNETYANEVVNEKIAEARAAAKEEGAFSEKTREKIIDVGTEIEAVEQQRMEAARAAQEARDTQKLLTRAMRGDAAAAAELEQRTRSQNTAANERATAGAGFEAQEGNYTAETENAPVSAQGAQITKGEASYGQRENETGGQSTYSGRENGAYDLRTGGEGIRAAGRAEALTGGGSEVRQSVGEYAQADLRQVTPAQLGIRNGGNEAVTLADAQRLGGEAKRAADFITANGREAVAVRGAIQVGGGYANAYVENGKVYYRVDATDAAGNPISPLRLAQHELFHEYTTPEVLKSAEALIRESMTAGEFDAMKESYRTAYAGIYDFESMSEAEIGQLLTEEIAADAYAGLNRFSRDAAVQEAIRTETERNAPAQRAEAQQNTTGPPRFSLNTYSEQQKANWSQSRKILVYENAEQLKNFVEKARADSGYVSKIYFGTVDGALAAEIMNETGYDLRGKNVTLRADNVRKIFKDHGQERTEAPRGQRPVTVEDFAKIPDVIGSPDSITEGDYFGKQAVEFKKVIDGSRITVFAVDSGGSSLDLYVQTMYAGKKKGSIADTANASALTQTPKTPAGTASFESNIRSSAADSQEKSSGRASVAGINARTANRRKLTAEERRKTPPDLGDADTVFADGNNISAYVDVDADGNPVTVVQTDKNVFDKAHKNAYANIAKKLIMSKYAGQTLPLGENDLVRITSKSGGEYGYPSTTIGVGTKEYEAKMRASAELHNLLENSTYDHWAPDTKNHKEATLGFDYYRTVFAVNGKIFEGLVNVANSENGRVLYDITKIREVPDTRGRYTALLTRASSVVEKLTKEASDYTRKHVAPLARSSSTFGNLSASNIRSAEGKSQEKSSGKASVEVENLTRKELKREYDGLKAEYDERLARYQAASSRNDEAYPYRSELRWSNEAARRLEELEKAIDGRKRRSVANTKRDIMALFHVDKANRAEIEQVLNREIGGIMKDGKLTGDTAERILDRLLEAGSFEATPENSPWIDETFVNVRNDLWRKKIYVSQQTWKDFGKDEAKSLRARARRAGITLTSNRSDMAADVHNMELAERYGASLFPTDTAETDMLRNIIDTAERGETAKQTLAERLWDEAKLAGGDPDKAYNEAVAELRGKMVTILREFAEDNRIEIDTEAAKPRVRRQPETSKRKDYRISVHRYSDSPAAIVTVTNDATGQKERVYIADAQDLTKTEMNAYGEKQIREMMQRNAAEAEKRETAAYEAAKEETKRKRTYEPIQAVGEYTEKLVQMETALETADNAVMQEGKNRYEARIAEEDGDVYAYVYKNGNLLAKAKGKNRKRATHWAANRIRADFGERTVFHPALQERGDYELDRKKAQKDGYPKLTKTNGERVQAVPFWTWVRSKDRKNYGLVVGPGGNRIGPDGQKAVDVYYYNKQKDTGVIITENAETVYAVDGQYSDMYAEEKARARMNDEAAETVYAESAEKDREAQSEGSPFEPRSSATTDERMLRTRNTSMGASEIFRRLISDGRAEVKTQTADSKIAEYSVKMDTNGVEHWADVFEDGKKKERFIESTAEEAAIKAAEYTDEEANRAFTAANAERAARREAEEAAEYDAKIAELFGEPEPGERRASEIIFPTRKPIQETEETAGPTAAEKAESKVAGEAVKAERDFRESVSDFTGGMMRMFVNAGDTVRRIAKATGDKSLEGYYFNAGAYSQRAGNWIAKGGARTDTSGKKTGASLEDMLAPMREDAKTYRDFQLYLLHMHNVDRMKYDNAAELQEIAKRIGEIEDTFKELKGMPNEYIQRTAGDAKDKAASMTREEMDTILAEMKDGEPLSLLKIKDAAQLLLHARDRQRIIQRQGLKPVFGYDVSAYDSQQAAQQLAEEHPEFKEWAKEVYKYSDDLINYRVETGMLTKKAAEAMKKRYPHYVPTLRVEGTTGKTARKARRNGGITVSDALGRAVGSDAVLLPLHTALSRKTVSVMRNAGMNQLGLRLVRLWEEQNGAVEKYIENVKESEYTATEAGFENDELFRRIEDNTMNVIDGGKRYEIRMDEGLTTAMNAQQPDRFANYAVAKGLKKINDLFKALCTGYNPFFMARNLVRDWQDAGFYSTDAKTWTKMYPAAVKQIAQNGEIWQQYKALGGSYASMLDYATGLTKAPKNRLGAAWAKYETLGQAIEAAPRLAEFMTILANKGGSKTVNGAEFTTADYMEAMLGAADITTNFARGGTVTKMLNRYIVPFLNPSVQGFDKFVRNATETKSVKAAGKLVWKAALMGIAPTILNALMYSDDEEWDEIPDQTKANYYLINFGNGYWLKIPKGRAIAVFSSLAVYGQEKAQGDDPKLTDVFEVIKSNVAPTDIFNQNIATALTQTKLFNPDNPGTTWYGGNIESDRLQNYRPGERYDEKTDELSKLIGRMLNLSPKKINYLLDQYTGVIGDFLLPMMTEQATASTPLLAPAKSAFMIDTTNTNKVTGEYYDLLDDLKYGANDGDTAADITRRYVNHAGDEVNDYYQQVREIQSDENLTKAEKNRLVRALKKALIARQEEIISDAEVYREAVEAYLRENPECATDNGAAVAEFAELYDITEEQAESRMEAIVYREANREVFGAEYALKTYSSDVYDKAKTAYAKGVSWDTYYDYYFGTKDMRADKDENGKSISGTKKAKVVEYINSLDIPPEQKDALYIAAGYTEKSTKNQPWNGGSGKSGGRRGGKRSTLKAPDAPKAAKITIPEAGTARSGAKASVKVADIAGAVDAGKIRKAAQKTAKTAIKAGNRTVYIEEGSPLDYFLKTGKLPSTK